FPSARTMKLSPIVCVLTELFVMLPPMFCAVALPPALLRKIGFPVSVNEAALLLKEILLNTKGPVKSLMDEVLALPSKKSESFGDGALPPPPVGSQFAPVCQKESTPSPSQVLSAACVGRVAKKKMDN